MAVEFEEVVGSVDQPPFGGRGGSASSLEAVDLAVELLVAKTGSIILVAFVELAAGLGVRTGRMKV